VVLGCHGTDQKAVTCLHRKIEGATRVWNQKISIKLYISWRGEAESERPKANTPPCNLESVRVANTQITYACVHKVS
jgi:hypothetical protein